MHFPKCKAINKNLALPNSHFCTFSLNVIYIDLKNHTYFAVPVAVFLLGVLVGLEIMSCKMLLIMSVISFGVLIASYGELNISWIGLFTKSVVLLQKLLG